MTPHWGVWSHPPVGNPASWPWSRRTSKHIRPMILQRTFLRLFAALALAGFSVASGATVTPPNNGDIFLGVRASGGQGSGVSLLINLGGDASFKNAVAGGSLSLGSLDAELVAAFGSSWATRSDLNWGIFGARNQTNSVVYGSRPQSPVGFPASAYSPQDLTQRTSTKNQIVSVADAYSQLESFSGNARAALQTNALNSGSYNFQVGSAGTSDFGSLSQWTTIEGDFGAGPGGTVLDFFQYGGTPTVPATERLGSFEITSAGVLSFTRSLPAGVAGIRLATSAFSVNEDGGTVTLTFRRTDDVSTAVSASFSTSDGSAAAGTDYTAQSNVPVSFAINEFEKSLTVPILDRTGISASRSFTVTLANASSGAQIVSPNSATITIHDTDSEVQFAAATVQVRALDVLNQPATVELVVNRSGSLAAPASVQASLSGGSLESGVDFTFASPVTLNFDAGASSKQISIPLNNIPVLDLPGTIVLTLGSVTGASLGTQSSVTVNVLPNSGVIAFASASQEVSAVTNLGVPSLITVNLSRSGGTVGAASVQVSVTGGSLVSGTHFTPLAAPTTVSFANGGDSASFSIQLNAIGSALLNSGATIQLSLGSPTNSATLGATSTTTITVVGSAGSISLGAASFNVREEVGTFLIPVVRSGGSSGEVSVRVSTAPGTAVSPADFTALNNVLVSFADGQTSATVPLAIANTVPNEPNETFTVTLGNAAGGASLGATTTATLRILDADNVAPTLALTAPKNAIKLSVANATVNLVGTAKDNKQVASILLELNGAAPVSLAFTTDAKGVASFNHPVTALRGTNIAVLRSLDHRGNTSAPVAVTYIYDDPFAALSGAYTGLSLASGSTVPSHSSSGLVSIQVLPAGTFSAKLNVDGLTLGFNGFIGTGGVARFGRTGDAKVRVERPNKPGFELAFVLDLGAGPGVKRINGTVREYRRSTLVGTSSFVAERAGFSKSASVPSQYLAGNGAYTFVLPSQPQSSDFSVHDYPRGDGVGTATVKADGTVSFAGILADGTKFTASSLLWADLRLPLYTELYGKAGSLGGIIAFNDSLSASDFRGDALFWFRPFQNVQHYPYGWPEGLATVLRGAKYAVGSTSSLGSLPAADANLGNALLEFSEGLLAADLTKAVNLDAKDKAVNAPAADKSFSLSIAQSKGLFSGKFTHSDGTQPVFNGVIFQKGPQRGGYGHFLSTTPKVRDGSGEAGAVTLSPRS